MTIDTKDLDFQENGAPFRINQAVSVRQVTQPGTIYPADEFIVPEDMLPDTFDNTPVEATNTDDWVIVDSHSVRVVSNQEYQQRFRPDDDEVDDIEANVDMPMPETAEETGPVVWACRLTAPDTVAFVDGTDREADYNDALVKSPENGEVTLVRATDFVGRYARCTRDGDLLCPQRGFLHHQAKALKRAQNEGQGDVNAHINDLRNMRQAVDAQMQADQPEADGPDVGEPEGMPADAMRRRDAYMMDAILNQDTPDLVTDEEAEEIAAMPDLLTDERADDGRLRPVNVGTALSQALAETDAGLSETLSWGMTPIKRMPTYTQNQIRSMGRRIFDRYANIPLEEVRAFGEPAGGPTDNVQRLYDWARANGQVKTAGSAQDIAPEATRNMPGYNADIEVISANNVDMMFVTDFAGAYVYVWPDDAPTLNAVAEAQQALGQTPDVGPGDTAGDFDPGPEPRQG